MLKGLWSLFHPILAKKMGLNPSLSGWILFVLVIFKSKPRVTFHLKLRLFWITTWSGIAFIRPVLVQAVRSPPPSLLPSQLVGLTKNRNRKMFAYYIRTPIWYFVIGKMYLLLPGYSYEVLVSWRVRHHWQHWLNLFELFVIKKEAGITV